MAGAKRGRAENDDNGVENVHPSRKRRLGYSEADAQRAKIFQNLADDLHATRIKAAGELLKSLSTEAADQPQQIDHALTRLIRGLCSGRKAARLGFSIALAETLRLAFKIAKKTKATEFTLDRIIDKIANTTLPENNASGQEKREHYLGRWFAYQAILQSGIATSGDLRDEDWKRFNDAVAELSSEKQWLRNECGAMLYDFLSGDDGLKLGKERALATIDAFRERDLLKTAEGVALWLLFTDRFSASDLPKGVWHKNNPLCTNERIRLKKILNGIAVEQEGENSTAGGGARQLQPSFAWKVILTKFFEQDNKGFKQFWNEAVDSGLFSASSSTERKSVGLQIVQVAISIAPASNSLSSDREASLRDILSVNVVRCLINQRSDPNRYLFEAAKVFLHHMVQRAKTEPSCCGDLVEGLISAGAVNLDQLTKTKTMESILTAAGTKSLKGIVRIVAKSIGQPGGDDAKEADVRRRQLVDVLCTILRTHQDPENLSKKQKKEKGSNEELASWVEELLRTLVSQGFAGTKGPTPAEVSPATRSFVRTRLMSCLRMLLNQPIGYASKAALMVVTALRELSADQGTRQAKDVEKLLKQTDKILTKLGSSADSSQGSHRAATEAYGLLFALSVLQVYNEEPEAAEILQDLITSFDNWRSGESQAAAMVIEILLSFVSKPSQLFRKLAEQVFATFAADLTAESLQSMLDILSQRENLSGQDELFDRHDDETVAGGQAEDNSEDDSDDDDDVELMDVDDVDVEDVEESSDIEIVNGQVVSKVDHDSSDDDSSEDEDGESESEDDDDGKSDDLTANGSDVDDEEAAFDRKLAEALGTQGMQAAGDDSDDDGSDMDDEQMMALEPHLTTIFRERKKTTGKKQNKDAREHIVHFKNRVLDLLAIFVKAQPANELTLDIIHPLTALMRTTSNKATSEKAAAVLKTHFEACTKQKVVPQPDDADAVFEVLSAVHEEVKQGGSKVHAHACSRASLFLSKVLVGMDATHYTRIAAMYAALQSEWYLDNTSVVQGSIFTEWTSWSLTTRRQK